MLAEKTSDGGSGGCEFGAGNFVVVVGVELRDALQGGEVVGKFTFDFVRRDCDAAIAGIRVVRESRCGEREKPKTPQAVNRYHAEPGGNGAAWHRQFSSHSIEKTFKLPRVEPDCGSNPEQAIFAINFSSHFDFEFVTFETGAVEFGNNRGSMFDADINKQMALADVHGTDARVRQTGLA